MKTIAAFVLATLAFIVAYKWVFLLGAYQFALIFLPHPVQIRRPWLAACVSLLTRFSLLRLRSAPGTPHIPLTRQPWWSPAELERVLGQLVLGQVRGEMQRLPPDGPRGVTITRGRYEPPALPTAGALALLLCLALLPACQGFAALADVAHRIYQAASDAEERASDDATKKSARACGKAGLEAERAAIAAQKALVEDAPGRRALKVAADAAEKRMHAACDPIKIDGSSVPPAAPDAAAHPADLRAAPDLGSGPAAPAAPADMAPRPAATDGGR